MTDEIQAIEALQDNEPLKPHRSQWGEVWLQFRQHKGAMVGGSFLMLITIAVIFGSLIWTVDPGKLDIRAKDYRPIYTALWDSDAKTGWKHPFGTDQLGRDGLANMLAGGRTSMAVGWAAMLLSLFLGAMIGVLAGYFKKLDGPLMRLTDLFLSLPILPLLLVAVTLFRQPLRANFGPEGGMFILIVGVIGITSWMHTARIVRGDVLALKEREFVLAARSAGTTSRGIIMRHLLPNVVSPIVVSATFGLATAIITESSLSFLGVGFPSDFPTWGKMLADSVSRMTEFPERVILPGIAISLTVLAVNFLGDGLRDALDPRIRGR
ncbi:MULTISPECIES: ABC transporter permease [Lentibacter]|jgi:peptide/nickel transport system permease protein|uniref:Peptide/nickel transport system permease protein n=2 Tax=Lentibacter algarum TaxID=576131 RepID=A0A1H3IBZ6_9RHOB|nr:ABC transporter permease [Lentibacter algarum]MCO4777682.1 ABC transporter permease [Lentibacter algarum]MCO4827525.1 ABC transporter permease [Lentibacter algarum]WIF31417.1 putative glutathione transport system permease protein GsiD [Lentibacter algarum]SDY24965.1 peptide/nickel transport system permease protein [Lentibacter algarum]